MANPRHTLATIATLVLIGCEEPENSAIQGTHSDITAQPGAFDGYQVESCSSDEGLRVVGTGTTPVHPFDILQPLLDDFASIHGYTTDAPNSAAASCLGDWSEVSAVWLDDYAEVDDLVQAIGAGFADVDGSGVLEIIVEPMPVAGG